MSETAELELFDDTEYQAVIRPLKTGGRRDVEVVNPSPVLSFDNDVVAWLRQFFERLDAEAQTHKGDPVALANGLARLEALLADMRFARDSTRKMCADALKAAKVRKLTVSDVITVEGTQSIDRSNWQHRPLMVKMLEERCPPLVWSETGEVVEASDLADMLLEWFRPEWRLTPIKEAGLDPHDFCDVATGEDGRPEATPTVRVVDNAIRHMGR